MSATLLTGLAIGIALGALLVIVRNVKAARYRAQAAARAVGLRMFATKRGLTLLDSHVPERAHEIARTYRGHRRRVQLEDLLRGSDAHGSFYICLRRVGRAQHHALLFETRIDGLEGCRIEPAGATSKSKALDGSPDEVMGGASPLRRAGRSLGALRGGQRHARRLRLVWEIEPSGLDERAAALAPKLLAEASAVSAAFPRVDLYMELQRDKAIIHTRRPVYREDLQAFADAALQLRDRTMQSLITGARETPTKVFTPVRDAPAVSQRAASKTSSVVSKASTAVRLASGAARAVAAGARGSSAVARPASGGTRPISGGTQPVSARFAFKPIDPANITSLDLVREHPAPLADKAEDELVILSGSLANR